MAKTKQSLLITIQSNYKGVLVFVFRFIPYSAIALYPFVLVKNQALKQNEVLIHHERIHLRQQIELLIIFFYLLYALNYLMNLIWYRNHYKAYREIVFEKEAYEMEKNLDYLQSRKCFSFIRWLN